jgi:hypothetical protein
MITISREQALEYLDHPFTNTEPTGERFRWSVGYRMIFLHSDGWYYEAHYRLGTGDEPEQPWQDQDTVECFHVRMVTKQVQVWERAE